MSSEDGPCLPKTSRFSPLTVTHSPDTNRPVWSTPAGSVDKLRCIHFNGISANSTYQPHCTPAVRARARPSGAFGVSSKIDVDFATSDSPDEIPVYQYGKDFLSDPILFVESVKEAGRKYGAVKVKMPAGFASQLQTDHQINPDSFLFRTNRVLNNPAENELFSRLKFYNELISFHTGGHVAAEDGMERKDPTKEGEGASVQAKETSNPESLGNQSFGNQSFGISENAENLGILPNPTSLSGALMQVNTPTDHTLPGAQTEVLNAETKTNTGNLALKTESPKLDADDAHRHKSKVPLFLSKVPTMDKRPLDLFELFRFVVIRGGYTEVINKKLWAQIGRELGYKGKTTGSLSTWLKMSYARILYPFEEFLGERKFEAAGLAKFGDGTEISKRQKLNSGAPLVLGSAKEFRRSVRAKASKGFLLNEPHLVDVKPPLVLAVKDAPNEEIKTEDTNGDITKETKPAPKKSEQLITPVSAAAQVNNFVKWLANSLSNIQDSSRYALPQKHSSSYTLKLYVDKDSKFQEHLVGSYPNFFTSESVDSSGARAKRISVQEYERLFWEFTTHSGNANLLDGMKLEAGTCVPNSLVGSAFYRLGDEFMNYKELLSGSANATQTVQDESQTSFVTLAENLAPKTETDTTNQKVHEKVHEKAHDGPEKIRKALHPFSIHNIPILPNSLLGAYSSLDVNSRDLVNSTLNVGMTFTAENWKCEDHFTQLCNFNFLGAGKRWYFIPELDFEKFEALVADVVKLNSSDEMACVNLNYREENWHFDQLAMAISTDDEATNAQYDCLLRSLESIVNPYPDIRVAHKSAKFQGLIERRKHQRSDVSLNQEYFVTPELLRERGIRFTTTVQHAGEYILKFPKTYSSNFSLGLNLSEEVNFASSLWLEYAEEGEKWLSKQGILPNILIFRMLINFAQLFEASDAKLIHFDADIYTRILALYSQFLDRELELRSQIREAINIKETTIEERNVPETDIIADDTLQNAFPSKIVITEISTHQQFIMTLDGFLEYLSEMAKDEESVHNVIIDDSYTIELQMMYSDEKLTNYLKLLKSYSVDYESWLTHYEELLKSDEAVTMKTYKSLLSDGWKIYSALSSSNDTFRRFTRGTQPESSDSASKIKAFQEEIENLQNFVDQSTELIEDCQSILALKHQQRIRNGGGDQAPQLNQEQQVGSLQLLLELVNKIPKVNFYTPEFDQIFEFKNEIENFDRACRALIQKPNASISELNDMISLGTSFGIHIPSLNFLRRLRNRQKWLETYDTIISGGDPFSGKKEIFALKHMVTFRDEGLQVLASSDVEKLQAIDQYVATGKEYDAAVTAYLHQNGVLNKVDLKELDTIIDDMVERSKNTGKDRLFVTMETYSRLLDLKAQAAHIEFLWAYPTKSHTLFDITQTLGELESCGFEYDDSTIQKDLTETQRWIDDADNLLKGNPPVSSLRTKLRLPPQATKHATHPQLIKTFTNFFNRCATAFAGEDVDSFTKSSSWMFLKNIEFVFDEKHPARYCMCRDYEDGVMVECDRCHEWYHVNCTDAKVDVGDENEKYSCPMCLAMDSYKAEGQLPEIKGKLTEAELNGLIARGESLRIVPYPEIQLLKSIMELVQRLTEYFEAQQNLEANVEYGPLYELFVSRKFFGSPVTNRTMLQKLFDTWKDLDVPGLFKTELSETTLDDSVPAESASSNSVPLDQETPSYAVTPSYPVTLSTRNSHEHVSGQTVAYPVQHGNLNLLPVIESQTYSEPPAPISLSQLHQDQAQNSNLSQGVSQGMNQNLNQGLSQSFGGPASHNVSQPTSLSQNESSHILADSTGASSKESESLGEIKLGHETFAGVKNDETQLSSEPATREITSPMLAENVEAEASEPSTESSKAEEQKEEINAGSEEQDKGKVVESENVKESIAESEKSDNENAKESIVGENVEKESIVASTEKENASESAKEEMIPQSSEIKPELALPSQIDAVSHEQADSGPKSVSSATGTETKTPQEVPGTLEVKSPEKHENEEI